MISFHFRQRARTLPCLRFLQIFPHLPPLIRDIHRHARSQGGCGCTPAELLRTSVRTAKRSTRSPKLGGQWQPARAAAELTGPMSQRQFHSPPAMLRFDLLSAEGGGAWAGKESAAVFAR